MTTAINLSHKEQKENKMATGDIKLLAANAITLAISMTHIEVTLKVILLLISIGYTVAKWVKLKEKK